MELEVALDLRALGAVVCLKLPVPTGLGTNQTAQIPPLNPGNFPQLPIPGYQNGVCVLESLHGATAVVYLDFQGGYTPTWGGVTYAPAGVSNDQVDEVFRRVAEDFMPFNINVTTDLQVYENAPPGSRQRVLITPTTIVEPDAGGVAYVGSFNWSVETPCWVFETSGKLCAEACSHEIGHTLNLANHEGQDYNGTHVEYYLGQGVGETGWAPIMGVGYYQNVSQWCHGEVQTTNAGSYQVVASNAVGVVTSSEADLSFVPVVAWGWNACGQIANQPFSIIICLTVWPAGGKPVRRN